MINAATVCRFMHKCADTCVCVADFDEFESKEGKIHTRARTYVANDRGWNVIGAQDMRIYCI